MGNLSRLPDVGIRVRDSDIDVLRLDRTQGVITELARPAGCFLTRRIRFPPTASPGSPAASCRATGELMHPLQETFATADGEDLWAAHLARLMAQGRLDEVEAVLAPLVDTLGGEMGILCEGLAAELVGWEVVAEAIEEHQGAPITGITVAIGNDPDGAHDKDVLHRPYTMMGLYSDPEDFDSLGYPWSQSNRDGLLAQLAAEGGPAWSGNEEDVEVHLDIEGLDAINAALVCHTHAYLPREAGTTRAPLRYVEYVLGCWWRAYHYHRAVARALAAQPLPGRVAVLSGTVDMRPDVVAIFLPDDAIAGIAPAVPTMPDGSRQGGKRKKRMALDGLVGEGVVDDLRVSHVDIAPEAMSEAVSDLAASPLVEPAPAMIPSPEPRLAPTPVLTTAAAEVPEPAFAALAGLDLVQRGVPVEDTVVTGMSLRHRVTANAERHDPPSQRPGLLTRLFGRR
jgi:hypothetical protein